MKNNKKLQTLKFLKLPKIFINVKNILSYDGGGGVNKNHFSIKIPLKLQMQKLNDHFCASFENIELRILKFWKIDNFSVL